MNGIELRAASLGVTVEQYKEIVLYCAKTGTPVEAVENVIHWGRPSAFDLIEASNQLNVSLHGINKAQGKKGPRRRNRKHRRR